MAEPAQDHVESAVVESTPETFGSKRLAKELSIFVPGHLAAVCASCGGFFLAAAGHCPGCGDSQYILASQIKGASS